MNPLEIEVKFHLQDIGPIRERIIRSGAESQGRFFETNIRYEDAEGSLVRKKSLLRLRKDRKATLTFKSEPALPDPDFKVHRELEVAVDDFETTDGILLALGFHRAQTYEKWRETFLSGRTIFCIDTLPFGAFLEIEGHRDDIRAAAQQIGLPWENRILSNYLALFDQLKKACSLPFSDITFDNFKTVTLDEKQVAGLMAANRHLSV
ncbi:MAG: class IV adenylate cyclase [Thermodesulfobacteriota bacterium]